MNPLTKDELNELLGLLPHVTLEWSTSGSGAIWVARRCASGRFVYQGDSRVERAQELVGEPLGGGRSHRRPRPGVTELLELLCVIHQSQQGPQFPD